MARPKAKTRALPGFLPMTDPIEVDRPPTGPGWAHEVKWDGYRVQAHKEGDRVAVYTRMGKRLDPTKPLDSGLPRGSSLTGQMPRATWRRSQSARSTRQNGTPPLAFR